MFTRKYEAFREFEDKAKTLFGPSSDTCIECATALCPEVLGQVLTLLEEYKIDSKAVEVEMCTVSTAFAFVKGWKSQHGHNCALPADLFLTVCYKFFDFPV